jgi:hypothetical protein
MINDAAEWLQRARDGFTDPKELEAIDLLLHWGEMTAVLSVVEGKPVWLFVGGPHQLAIPLDVLPDLTNHARETGLFDKFHAQFATEVRELIDSVYRALFPEDA